MNQVKITLPPPYRQLSPNARVHHIVLANWKARYKRDAERATRSVVIGEPRWPRASVKVTFYFRDNRRRDEDNAIASLKSAFDGVVEAGLIADDSHKNLVRLPVDFLVDREDPRVELVFTRIL